MVDAMHRHRHRPDNPFSRGKKSSGLRYKDARYSRMSPTNGKRGGGCSPLAIGLVALVSIYSVYNLTAVNSEADSYYHLDSTPTSTPPPTAAPTALLTPAPTDGAPKLPDQENGDPDLGKAYLDQPEQDEFNELHQPRFGDSDEGTGAFGEYGDDDANGEDPENLPFWGEEKNSERQPVDQGLPTDPLGGVGETLDAPPEGGEAMVPPNPYEIYQDPYDKSEGIDTGLNETASEVLVNSTEGSDNTSSVNGTDTAGNVDGSVNEAVVDNFNDTVVKERNETEELLDNETTAGSVIDADLENATTKAAALEGIIVEMNETNAENATDSPIDITVIDNSTVTELIFSYEPESDNITADASFDTIDEQLPMTTILSDADKAGQGDDNNETNAYTNDAATVTESNETVGTQENTAGGIDSVTAATDEELVNSTQVNSTAAVVNYTQNETDSGVEAEVTDIGVNESTAEEVVVPETESDGNSSQRNATESEGDSAIDEEGFKNDNSSLPESVEVKDTSHKEVIVLKPKENKSMVVSKDSRLENEGESKKDSGPKTADDESKPVEANDKNDGAKANKGDPPNEGSEETGKKGEGQTDKGSENSGKSAAETDPDKKDSKKAGANEKKKDQAKKQRVDEGDPPNEDTTKGTNEENDKKGERKKTKKKGNEGPKTSGKNGDEKDSTKDGANEKDKKNQKGNNGDKGDPPQNDSENKDGTKDNKTANEKKKETGGNLTTKKEKKRKEEDRKQNKGGTKDESKKDGNGVESKDKKRDNEGTPAAKEAKKKDKKANLRGAKDAISEEATQSR